MVGIVAVVMAAVLAAIVVAAGGKKPRAYAEPRTPAVNEMPAATSEPKPTPQPKAMPASRKDPDPASVSRPGGSVANRDLWEMWINALKRFSVGDDGEYDFIEDEPKSAFESIKSRRRDAYPYLIAYLGDEELQRTKGAAVALRRLSGIKSRVPKNLDDAKQLMSEWKKLLNVSDAEVDAAVSVIRK